MPVLTAVCVSITDDVVFVVIDGEMAINLVILVDSIVDGVLICAEDCWIVFIAALIAVEKLLPGKAVANRGIAVLLFALGLAVAFVPEHLPGRTIPEGRGTSRG
jgi:type VI protein secretion system component VasK